MRQTSMQSSISCVGSFPGTQQVPWECRACVSPSLSWLFPHVLFLGHPLPVNWTQGTVPPPPPLPQLWSFSEEQTEVFFPFSQDHISIILNGHHPPFSKPAPEDREWSGKHLGKPGSFHSTMALSHTTSSPRTRPTHCTMLPLQSHHGCEGTTSSLPHFPLSLCCLVNSNSFFRSLLRYHILHEAWPDSILPREAQDPFWISQHPMLPHPGTYKLYELLYNMTLGNRGFSVSHPEEREKSLSIKFLWYIGLKIKGTRSSWIAKRHMDSRYCKCLLLDPSLVFCKLLI